MTHTIALQTAQASELSNQWSPGGGDSYMESTGMLVGNFEFNP